MVLSGWSECSTVAVLKAKRAGLQFKLGSQFFQQKEGASLCSVRTWLLHHHTPRSWQVLLSQVSVPGEHDAQAVDGMHVCMYLHSYGSLFRHRLGKHIACFLASMWSTDSHIVELPTCSVQTPITLGPNFFEKAQHPFPTCRGRVADSGMGVPAAQRSDLAALRLAVGKAAGH